MIDRLGPVILLGLAVACVGPYTERPAPTAERPPSTEREDPAAPPAGATVVGHVTPDGRFHPDTGTAAAEPAPVERRTVVTGTVRTAPTLGAPLATGYRVQVFAAPDQPTAAAVARRLEGRLERQPVYIERADPWFKVRVGDFATREEAERLRARLVEMGYAEAWTARTTIRTAR